MRPLIRRFRISWLAILVTSAVTVALAALAVVGPWLCAWVIFLAVAIVSWRVSWRSSRDPFAPLLPVTAYLFLGMGIRGLALREKWLQDTYNVPLGNQWLTASVWLLGALAIGACVLGYRSGTALRFGRSWARWQWIEKRWPRETVIGCCTATALIGILSLALLHHRFAGAVGFGKTPAAVASQTSEGGLFTTDMLSFFPFFGALFAWRRKGLGIVGWCALVTNFGVVIAWFLLAGTKSLLFELILGLLILRHYLRKPIRGRTLILFTVPAMILISLAFYFKAYGFQTQSITAEYSAGPAWEAVVDPLLDRSYQFDATTMILSKTTSVNDYRLGSTFDELAWFYVPRQWWPGKPVSFGFTFAPEFFPGDTLVASYTPSMVGELYLNFGVLGVIAGFYLFGLVLRASYEAFARRRSQLAAVAYTIVLFRLTNMVEGPVATHIEFLLAEILPMAAFIVVANVMPGRPATGEEMPGTYRPLQPAGLAALSGGRQMLPGGPALADGE